MYNMHFSLKKKIKLNIIEISIYVYSHIKQQTNTVRKYRKCRIYLKYILLALKVSMFLLKYI